MTTGVGRPAADSAGTSSSRQRHQIHDGHSQSPRPSLGAAAAATLATLSTLPESVATLHRRHTVHGTSMQVRSPPGTQSPCPSFGWPAKGEANSFHGSPGQLSREVATCSNGRSLRSGLQSVVDVAAASSADELAKQNSTDFFKRFSVSTYPRECVSNILQRGRPAPVHEMATAVQNISLVESELTPCSSTASAVIMPERSGDEDVSLLKVEDEFSSSLPFEPELVSEQQLSEFRRQLTDIRQHLEREQQVRELQFRELSRHTPQWVSEELQHHSVELQELRQEIATRVTDCSSTCSAHAAESQQLRDQTCSELSQLRAQIVQASKPKLEIKEMRKKFKSELSELRQLYEDTRNAQTLLTEQLRSLNVPIQSMPQTPESPCTVATSFFSSESLIKSSSPTVETKRRATDASERASVGRGRNFGRHSPRDGGCTTSILTSLPFFEQEEFTSLKQRLEVLEDGVIDDVATALRRIQELEQQVMREAKLRAGGDERVRLELLTQLQDDRLCRDAMEPRSLLYRRTW